MRPDNPIILALDFDSLSDAEQMLSKVRPHIGMIKIGLELFIAYGKDTLALAQDYDIPVFLDLKLHDIPNTVGKTMSVLCKTLSPLSGKHFVSIHCFGGKEMCKQAILAAQSSNVIPTGVTLLTSLDSYDLGRFGFRDCRLGYKAVDLAAIGHSCLGINPPVGLESFVCAPQQLKMVRNYLGDDATIITPGIRLNEAESDDHKNVKSASFAMKNGATWLVIGRPITQASDPATAAEVFKTQAGIF